MDNKIQKLNSEDTLPNCSLQIKRGPEESRLSYTPLPGEMIYATDTKKVFIGDGKTSGGNLIGPMNIFEWNFKTVIDQVNYTVSTDQPSLCDPLGGIYLLFLGSSRIQSSDYTIDVANNSLSLSLSPTENNVDITLIYIGK